MIHQEKMYKQNLANGFFKPAGGKVKPLQRL